MLRFVVESPSDIPADALRHAVVLVRDDYPVPSDVRAEGTVIVAERRGDDASAIALQLQFALPAGAPEPSAGRPSPGGLLVLQTCLLPQRDEPYLLVLELARHRLMQVLNKMEDWALFDLPADHPVPALVERARSAFTAALLARPASGVVPAPAYAAARDALALALEAGDALALEHARVLHARRMSGELAQLAAAIAPPSNAITDHETRASRNARLGSVGVLLPAPASVGCAIEPARFTPEAQRFVAQSCDFVTVPMRWVDMEPTEGRYVFTPTDRCIEWAVRTARLPIRAGPIIDLRARCVPEWLFIWEHDYDTLRDLVAEHVKNVVTRYRRTVAHWTVVSGLHTGTGFGLTDAQALDLTRIGVLLVRKLHPAARIDIEIAQPWGEYAAAAPPPRSIAPTVYAEAINQAGSQLGGAVDGFALRIQMGQAEPGRATRDLMSLSALLDRFGSLEKPVTVTALGCPSMPPDLAGDAPDPGYWRETWSPAAQARWLSAATAVVASKPYVAGICWQQLLDDPTGDMPAGGLLTAAGQPKPAAARFLELRQALRDRAPEIPGTVPEDRRTPRG